MAGLHDVNIYTNSFFSDARLKITPLKKETTYKDDNNDPSNLFAIPDFWRPSNWLGESIEEINKQNPLFSWGSDVSQDGLISAHLQDHIVPDLGSENDDAFFKLPPILKDLVAQHTQAPETDIVQDEDQPELDDAISSEEEDFWLLPNDVISTKPQYKTWESFESTKEGPTSPGFITEAGPAAFDSIIAASNNNTDDTPPDILDNSIYSACLLALALGRSSLLFAWDSAQNSFTKTAPQLRTSGITLDLIKAIDRLCLDCGNCMRHLQYYSETAYASSSSSPTRIAFAGVIARLITTVGSELSTRSRNVRSILQLQALVQPVHTVLSYFKGLVKKVATAKTDEAMLSALFQAVQAAEYKDDLLRAATNQVLRIVSRPWADFVEEWIGIKVEEGIPISKTGSGKEFVRVADKMWVDDQGFELDEPEYFLDEAKMPSFVPADMAESIFETGRNLRFLREHHPDHPLSRPDVVSLTNPPKLEWEFEWGAISKLEGRVNEYRDAVSRVLEGGSFLTGTTNTTHSDSSDRDTGELLTVFGKPEAEVASSVLASIRRLDEPLLEPPPSDNLVVLLKSHLYSPLLFTHQPSLSPHTSLLPLLSFSPLLTCQSELLSHLTTKLLFTAHSLRLHLSLLNQSFLLSSGLLVSRLSSALFDPESSTTERHKGVALGGSGSLGLRLGSTRRTWPPASSELRLALMGVLSDSLSPSVQGQLPGDLSFAIRHDLTQEEIDRCMNVDSLSALDFLRLSYTTPPPLRGVITPQILAKFDRISRLLVQILRMLHVANTLFHSFARPGEQESSSNVTLRFAIEARHFILAISSYFFDVGIAKTWRGFETWLDTVETSLHNDNIDGEVVTAISPEMLRQKQESTLDTIMSCLLLRKRQQPVMGLLEEILTLILIFARLVRVRQIDQHLGIRGEEEDEEESQQLYKKFHRKVDVFVTVLQGLSEKTPTAEGRRDENTVEMLLAKLDLEGWYGKKR
ncbi:Spc98 family-domain-containing protein [Triangularia setosa]|uniref:Spindle pole body component n=1 Tax=Triangularia setosa TaxID=2587417 RepID=A0AAN7AC75_9PEZI|nr:Spc98 family-domain-containing protein [Podospora setosa]